MAKEEDDDKFEKMDEASLSFLEQVRKGKARNFVLSMKGNKVRSMVVKKKPIKESDKKAARGGGFQPVYGVASGAASNITFNVARSDGFDEKTAGTKTEKLKKFLKEQTGKPFKPTIELVDTPPPIPFDEDDLNDPLIARFMKMDKEINEACDKDPDQVNVIQTKVSEIRSLLQDEETREQAGPKIDDLDQLLKDVMSGNAPTSSTASEPSESSPTTDAPSPPPAPDSEIGKLGQALKKLKPLVEKAITNHPDRKGELLKSLGQIAGEIKNNQVAEAKENMLSFVAMVKPLAANGPETSSDTSTSEPDPSVEFNKRLKGIIPQIKQAAGSPAGDEAKLKASEAGAFAAKKDFVQANAMLDHAEGLLNGSIPPSGKVTPDTESLDDRNVVTKWNEVREELQPLVDEAAKLGTEQTSKIVTAWGVALETARQGDFDKAQKIAARLRDPLNKLLEQPKSEPEPIGTENVSSKALIIEMRESISGSQSKANAFGSSYPSLWSTRISSAQNLVDSAENGSLEELQEVKKQVDEILNELNPKIEELTSKKGEFEKLKQTLENKLNILTNHDAVKNEEALEKRLERLNRDKDQANDRANDEFKYDEAISAIEQAINLADQLDEDADGWSKVQAIYLARKKLVQESAALFSGLGGPPQELIDDHTEIDNAWTKVHDEWQKANYAESKTAGDRIPGLVSTFKRKVHNFSSYNVYPQALVNHLATDKAKYKKEHFELIYPAALRDKIKLYEDNNYKLPLDDSGPKDVQSTWKFLLSVRGRADLAVAYLEASEELTKIRDDALNTEPVRRALKYVAPDYFDRMQDALDQGQSAANRQEYAKAKVAIDTGKTFADAQKTAITDCQKYIQKLVNVSAQLETLQSKYTSDSAQKSAEAASMAIMEADNLAMAKDFDSAEKRLEAIETQLKDITTSEDLSKSLSDARDGTAGQPGSEEATKDIALVESAIKSSEESSSKEGIAFEWLPLAAAKLSLVEMKRADKDDDATTLSEERQKALSELSTLTDQLSSYRTSRSLRDSLQEQLKKADVLFQAMSGNTLPVAVELSNQFNAIKDKLTKEVVEPLASTKQPDFAAVLDSISTLRVNLPLWQASAAYLKPYSDAANDAETAIKQLEDTDVPQILAANNGFDARFKDPLDKLPVEKRVQDLRRRKDELGNKVAIANLAASTSDMNKILFEARRFQAEKGEFISAINAVGGNLNGNAAAIENLFNSMEQAKRDQLNELVGKIEKAAENCSPSAIRTAANETWHYVLMVNRLKASRESFLVTYNELDQKLKDAVSDLDSLTESTLINQRVNDVKSNKLTPARTELDLLKTDGEADSNTYPAATVNVAKAKAKVAAVETAVKGLESVADLAADVQKQLEDLQPVARIATFKSVVDQVEKHNQAAGQLLVADPADFKKAKSEFEAAKSLAASAIQGMGAKTNPLADTSSDSPNYEDSCNKLREQVSTLKSTAGTLVVGTGELDPLETEITEIEKLISAETV